MTERIAVVGIDLSLTQTGLAVITDGGLAETRTVKTTGKIADSLEQRKVRIFDIVNQIGGFVDRWLPDLAVIEAPSFGSNYGSAHDRAGLWWGTVEMLMRHHIPVAQISPKQRAKYATGNGNADKKLVHGNVILTYGSADNPIKTNDEADATILAAMGSRYLGKIVEKYDLPDDMLVAMEKVQWPV
jgi:Holliday junction resolvasome RuvABC endonuclease subunit